MLLKLISGGALIAALASVFLMFATREWIAFGPLAIQSIIAFALLTALGDIVDTLEVIAENTKKEDPNMFPAKRVLMPPV